MKLMISLLRISGRLLLGTTILAIVLVSAYVLSIGPVSKYAVLSEPSGTFPQWYSDLYQPLFELYDVPIVWRPLCAYCDLWGAPYWLPDSALVSDDSCHFKLQ